MAETALVTGGSSGIGKMIASGLAQNGAHVYIAARKEGQLKEVRTTVVLVSWALHLIYYISLKGSSRSSQKCKRKGRLYRRGPQGKGYVFPNPKGT